MVRPPRSALLALALAVVLVACGSESVDVRVDAAGPELSPAPSTTTVPPTTSTTTVPETPYRFHGDLEPHHTKVALLTESVEVFASPGDDQPFMTQAGSTWFGANQVLTTVVDSAAVDGWAEVLLPGRPNDRTGWIKTDEMHFYVVGSRIVVNLKERTLVYYEDGEVVLEAPVAIGTPRNPTPTGTFFVTDSIRVPGPPGPFGTHALALSARSDTITEFNGGDGIIGIHGTNRPNLIGQAVSLGCIRLNNSVISRLWELVPVGTPVEIVAG